MKRFSPSPLVVALLFFAAASPMLGFEKKKKASPPPLPAQTVIASADANSITISDEKGSKTFAITQFTEIRVNGQKATAADLKPGMTVDVVIGTDAARASRIIASAKK